MCENYNGSCFLLHHCRGDMEGCARLSALFSESDDSADRYCQQWGENQCRQEIGGLELTNLQKSEAYHQ